VLNATLMGLADEERRARVSIGDEMTLASKTVLHGLLAAQRALTAMAEHSELACFLRAGVSSYGRPVVPAGCAQIAVALAAGQRISLELDAEPPHMALEAAV
jgi:hypothetical protein